MMLIEKGPELDVLDACSECETNLVVERTDILFLDLPGDRVRIQVTVQNAGRDRSAPTPMRLESAPLGAFVPWQPLAMLVVPALDPGESYELNTDVARSRPVPLGDFDRVPPRRLLTALSAPDQPSQGSGNGVEAMLNLFRTARRAGRDAGRRGTLAPDLWQLIKRGQPHWAGNINVFVGSRPVERHLARALRVYPGRTNLAMFVVGSPGRRDAYAFQLVGLATEWQASLHNMRNNQSLVINTAKDVAIEETKWVQSDGGLVVMLATQPPPGCHTGNLEAHVTQRSTGKEAIVEFNLDPRAQGAGCYFV